MRRGLLLFLVAALLAAPSALAGPPGTWTAVTPPYDQNFNLVGLQRTADGVLHVAVQQRNAANPQHGDFIHVPIGAAGTISADWTGTNSPDIVANPGGGLLAIWGGIHSTTTGDPLNNGTFATSDDSGAAWNVDPAGPWPSGGTAGGTYVYAAQVSAENGADGTPFEAWSHDGVYVHRGLDPNVPVSDYNQPLGGDTGAVPDLARDGSSGALWLGWNNELGQTGLGVWAQQVDQATGAPLGSPIQMPGTPTEYQGARYSPSILGRTPITGRPGRPGAWMAYAVGYPSAKKLIVWKVGDSSTTTLADGGAEIRHVAITSDADGRLIVVWGDESSLVGRMFARVSTTDGAGWGPAFAIPAPKGATDSWALEAAGQSGGLTDVVAQFSDASGMRFWHTQALAPPVLAKEVDASVVSGVVLVKLPGSNSFVPLAHDSLIPVGAVVDATRGRVRIVTALPGGRTQTADFFQGVFQVTQARTGVATMVLTGGSFAACARAKRAASAAKTTVIRKLWGAGSGKFRTKGRYAAAAVRGTTWLTADRCDGTLVRVTRGAVTVRDLVKKKNVVLIRGQSYLARR